MATTLTHDRALNILNIDADRPYDDAIIRKQYHRLALKYHPDKNKDPAANARFQEINAAYRYLQGTSNNTNVEYKTILLSFLRSILKNEIQYRFIYSIIELIQKMCTERIHEIFDKISYPVLSKIYLVLDKYRDVLHLSDEVMDMIRNYLLNKERETATATDTATADANESDSDEDAEPEYIVILPSLENLLLDNVYVLHKYGEKYIIPLWIDELTYERSDPSQSSVKKDLCVL